MRLSRTFLLLPLLSLAACVPESDSELDLDDDLDEEVGVTENELNSELWGGTAEIVSRYYGDPAIARASYATPTLFASAGNCSATMIGPNMLMTAAHCGDGNDAIARFRTYRNLSVSTADTDDFSCDPLITTYCDADTILYFCDPNAAGENPGDKYGYLDLDTSVPAVGQSLYSVWSNPVLSQAPVTQLLYSQGSVLANNNNDWFVAADNGTGIFSSLYAIGGASGSPQINPANGRVMVGPLSTGDRDNGGSWRIAGSMNNILYWGRADANQPGCPSVPPVHNANVIARGLTPSNYLGWVDRDSDWLFDIQEDIERQRGEANRPFYWLGFESERRNNLWERAAATSFVPGSGWARITRSSTSGSEVVLRHPRLNLQASTPYRVSFERFISSSGNANALTVSLVKSGVTYATYNVNTSGGGGWKHEAFEMSAPVAGAELRFTVNGSIDAYVKNVRLAKEYNELDFDNHDERMGWENGTGGLAHILPDGNGAGPNFAAVVRNNVSSGSQVHATTRQLALVPGKSYLLCFQEKNALASGPGGNWATLKVTSGATQLARVDFAPGASWQSLCTGSFTVPSAGATVDFSVGSTVTASYLVDSLLVWKN